MKMLSADQIREVVKARSEKRAVSDKNVMDVREEMWKLHDKGEIIVIPIEAKNKPVNVRYLGYPYGQFVKYTFCDAMAVITCLDA